MSTGSENQRRIGPFLLEDELGVGGMGIVYRATYEKNGMKCAVKVLSPDLSGNDSVNQRFIRETEILKKLQHPHIIRYFGAGSSRTQRFYAMELVEGGSLDNIMKTEGRLGWEQTVEYAMQVAKALEHAHQAGIIHRDLKPGNLLLTKSGVLKLSDFGIARDMEATALTQAGKTVGTMAYMAPEQISGKSPVTRRTDLYALGCVMFEMLTGEPPFQAETQAELLFKHLQEDPPSVRDFNQTVPLWLTQLVDELLQKDPDERPFDALAVQVKLDEVKAKVKEQETRLRERTMDGASVMTAAHEKKTSQQKKRKKKKKGAGPAPPFYERAWFLALLLLIVVGVGAGLFVRSRSEEYLYSKAAPRMRSEDPSDWIAGENDLRKMLEWYPEGKHAEEGRLWLDNLEMYIAEKQIETRRKNMQEPATEAERLYVEAQQYENFGDRLTALEKYESIPKVVDMTPKTRPVLNLARRQAAKIKKQVSGETDRTAFIRSQLKEADELFVDGQRIEAREKWQAIVRLYGTNPEFDTYTSEARERLAEIRETE